MFSGANEHVSDTEDEDEDDFNVEDFFVGISAEDDHFHRNFLQSTITVLIVLKNTFARSSYSMSNSTLPLKDKLTFANDDDCKAKLSKLQQSEFVKCSNFVLYQYCTRSKTFKTLVLESTLAVCVFIGLMFPVCVSSPEELFELFHAVCIIITYYNIIFMLNYKNYRHVCCVPTTVFLPLMNPIFKSFQNLYCSCSNLPKQLKF